MSNPNTLDSHEELPGELQALWQSGRTSTTTSPSAEDAVAMRVRLARLIRQPQRVSIGEQVATIIILSVLVVVLLLFFRYVSPLGTGLSQFGMGFMVGSVGLRILIEVISLYFTRRISLFDDTAVFVRKTRRFLLWRVHLNRLGVFPALWGYTIGYYLLMPEYAAYFSTAVMCLLIVSYPVIMGLVGWFAMRPGMARERAALVELERVVGEVDAGGGQ